MTPPRPAPPPRARGCTSAAATRLVGRRRAACWWLGATLAVVACSTETSDEPQDAGDGKVHPPPNGVHIGEDLACTRLVEAFRNKSLELGCSVTARPCPNYLRAQFQTACMEYDEGSVAGCEAHYQSVVSCEALDPTFCVVTPYPGTEPAGCPP